MFVFCLVCCTNSARREGCERCVACVLIMEDENVAGYLMKQGGGFPKRWQKRYFVISGLRLRWYETKEAYDGAEPHLNEVRCGSIKTNGKIASIKDTRGTRDLLVRSDML